MNRDIRVSARITGNLYKKANKEAVKRKWTLSDLVEEALVKFLEA